MQPSRLPKRLFSLRFCPSDDGLSLKNPSSKAQSSGDEKHQYPCYWVHAQPPSWPPSLLYSYPVGPALRHLVTEPGWCHLAKLLCLLSCWAPLPYWMLFVSFIMKNKELLPCFILPDVHPHESTPDILVFDLPIWLLSGPWIIHSPLI